MKSLDKLRKQAVFAALVALVALPFQQWYVSGPALRKTGEKAVVSRAPEEGWSEGALSGNAAGVVMMAVSDLRQGHAAAAEAWLKFGCFQLRAPSVMLFYGDMLRQRGEHAAAARLYRFALGKARAERAPAGFISALEKRLEEGK